MAVWADRLRAAVREECEAVGVRLSGLQATLLLRHLDLVDRWRSRAGLTAVDQPLAAVRLHVADSLLCLRAGLPEGASLVDVGSGAGFPGIPLAIVRPDLAVTLLEPAERKAAFLEMACRELALPVQVLRETAEDAGRGALRERFGVAVARALAPLAASCELVLPLVRMGGMAVLLKGPSVKAELAEGAAAAEALGGGRPEVSEWRLAGGERRVVVVIPKRGPTPEGFPRRPGVPRRRPLRIQPIRG